MNDKAGGPAFPMQPIPPTGPQATSTGTPFSMHGVTDVWSPGSPGMTLRDYFAGRSLQGMLSGDGELLLLMMKDKPASVMGELLAESAYSFADAMLAERAKVPS